MNYIDKNSLFRGLNHKESKDSFLLVLVGITAISTILISFVFFPLDNLNFGKLSRNQKFDNSFAAEKIKVSELKKNLVGDESGKISKVLTETGDYKIDRQTQKDSFSVIIKKAPFVESRVKAEQWFLTNGFSQQDLCSLKIFFYPDNSFGKDYWPSNQELVPSGCSVAP